MSGSHLSKEFFDLVKAIGESKSKQEEDRIIISEVKVLKKRLQESGERVIDVFRTLDTDNSGAVSKKEFRKAIVEFGDGIDDVFYADGSRWLVSYSGTSSWQTLNWSSATVDDIVVGDFDGNGEADVFTAYFR